jgi:class 3 adenylate cyclase
VGEIIMMFSKIPDLHRFEMQVFRKKNVLGLLLKFSRGLLKARQAGVLYGTDHTGERFLPPRQWDRGVVHQMTGPGLSGVSLKWIGPILLRWFGISPIWLYKKDAYGRKIPTDGVIAHVIRKHSEYYDSGIKMLFTDHIPRKKMALDPSGERMTVTAFDGRKFDVLPDMKVNMDVIRWFKPDNFMSIYIPDYGAIVLNTVDPKLFEKTGDAPTAYSSELISRLELLISAIETASLALLGQAKGRRAAKIIRRKERNLRKAFFEMKEKTRKLDALTRHLQSVGAVTPDQLNMAPLIEPHGVFAFLDMVSSTHMRTRLSPRDFFEVLNLCHEITADTAATYGCRVDNFLGDAVFLEHAALFDLPDRESPSGISERVMIMTMALADVLTQIHALNAGNHQMDPQKQVADLVKTHGIAVEFRAGMSFGSALVGPLGSVNRRIVTSIGKPVNIASRLESTGRKNCIHMEKKGLEILVNSTVSQSTPMLWKLASSDPDIPVRPNVPFLEFLAERFHLSASLIEKMPPISYKDFVIEGTCLICCEPGDSRNDVCAGI